MHTFKVSLEIEIKVEEAEDVTYFLDPVTNKATPSFIADIMDEMEDSFAGEVLTVNGLTPAAVQKKLQDGLV
jgi:hypothetical protein